MIAIGEVIGGRLRIDQILGAGGMGIVAAATHLELGHRVAIKVLRDELAANPTVVERFLREARSVVNLRTEHVCRVLDVGRQPSGAPFIVMEMLEGSDLAQATAQRPLPVTTAVEYVLQACVALAEAHLAGIIHRDLKPANLFVVRRPDGGPLVKVLDFGIAKAVDSDAHLTRTTGAMGSPGYMSPEQIQSARDVDARTDIWALGVTLYQLISGRMPFWSNSIAEIAVKISIEPPPPIDADPALAAVIMRCLDKVPDRRYPDVAALGADLARFGGPSGRALAAQIAQIARKPGTAMVPPPSVSLEVPTAASLPQGTVTSAAGAATMPPPANKSRRWIGIAIALVVAAGGGAAAVVAMQRRGPAPARDAAQLARASQVDAALLDAAQAIEAAPRIDAAAAPGGDPWDVPQEGPSLPRTTRDAGVHVAPARPSQPMPTPAVPADALKQARQGCTNLLSHPEWLKNLGHDNIAQCYCVIGDASHAKAELAQVTDANRKNAIAMACKAFGVTL